jgi:hypothetical protein
MTDTVEETLRGKDAFVKRLDGTYEKYESIVRLREDVYKLQAQVDKLKNSGLNYDTIIILLAHSTKLSQKTIRQVLEGLEELPEKYFHET